MPAASDRASPSAGASAVDPSASAAAEPGAWQPGPVAPIALTEVAAAAHGGAIWVAGGLDAAGEASDRVLVLDPASGAWSDGPRLPEPVHHAALVSDGTGLILLGGYVGSGFDRPTAAVRMLAPSDGAWRDHVSLPEPRAAGAAAWDGTTIVYGGGVGLEGVSPAAFVLGAGAWAPAGRLSEAREHLAAASNGDGTTFFLGGRRGGLDGNRSTVDIVDGDDPQRLGDLPTPRGGVAAFWAQTLGACLIGGESPEGTNAQVECITDDGSTSILPDLAIPRHGLGAAVVDGHVYALLGGPEPGLFVSDAVELLALRG